MGLTSESTAPAPSRVFRPALLAQLLDSERLLPWVLLAPAAVLLALFVAYPFVMGIWLALSSASVANAGHFSGLRNFVGAWHDSIFRRALANTFIYTVFANALKLAFGMWLAVLLNQQFRGIRLLRAAMLLPFVVPTVLSALAWRWMLDPTFSVLNWLLYRAGLTMWGLPFLSNTQWALGSAICVNAWRGTPFFAITLLAGLQTINPELNEAAALDGAGAWRVFQHVTWPLLQPITAVVLTFSLIQTFADFQLIYVLTGGGPADTTQLVATYAYQIGIGAGLLGQGAAMSLFMFPVLFAVVWFQLRYVRRTEPA